MKYAAHQLRIPFAVFALALLLASSVAAKEDKQQRGAGLLARARELSDLDCDGCSPYRLKANLKVENFLGAPAEGTYLMVWASERQWREEIVLANYREVRIAAEGKTWRTRSLTYTPEPVASIRRSVDLVRELRLQDKPKIISIREKSIANESFTCLEERVGRVQLEACVDPSNGALRWANGLRWQIEYSDYASHGARLIPRKIRLVSGEKITWECQVSYFIPGLGENPSSFFTVPVAAQEWAFCAHPTSPIPIKITQAPRHVQPHPDLLVGLLEMFVEMGPDGLLHNATVLGSTNPVVGKAIADNAVRTWKFKPARCGMVPVPSEFTMQFQYYF